MVPATRCARLILPASSLWPAALPTRCRLRHPPAGCWPHCHLPPAAAAAAIAVAAAAAAAVARRRRHRRRPVRRGSLPTPGFAPPGPSVDPRCLLKAHAMTKGSINRKKSKDALFRGTGTADLHTAERTSVQFNGYITQHSEQLMTSSVMSTSNQAQHTCCQFLHLTGPQGARVHLRMGWQGRPGLQAQRAGQPHPASPPVYHHSHAPPA